MLLQWSGLQVSKEQVADALVKEPNALLIDSSDTNGTAVVSQRAPGGNPHRAFVGSPYDKESFGVFHEPIAQALDSYHSGRARDISGQVSFDELLRLMQESNTPIIVWITLELREPRVTDQWPDVHDPSHTVSWQSPEHCALMVGFTEQHVIINDPHTGKQEHYDRELVERRWKQLGSQAVTLARAN